MKLVDGWISEDLAHKVKESSDKLARLYGWRHRTISMEAGIVFDIDRKELDKLTWEARVAITEETKLMELLLKSEGIPCGIQIL